MKTVKRRRKNGNEEKKTIQKRELHTIKPFIYVLKDKRNCFAVISVLFEKRNNHATHDDNNINNMCGAFNAFMMR